jgi:hypothetical protein
MTKRPNSFSNLFGAKFFGSEFSNGHPLSSLFGCVSDSDFDAEAETEVSLRTVGGPPETDPRAEVELSSVEPLFLK